LNIFYTATEQGPLSVSVVAVIFEERNYYETYTCAYREGKSFETLWITPKNGKVGKALLKTMKAAAEKTFEEGSVVIPPNPEFCFKGAPIGNGAKKCIVV
jgi:hypothetical protein